jgi:hypothetical protein
MGRVDRGGGTVSSARRFTGIGATIAALAIILSGCLPPKPPPPPPPKFRLAAGLWHTFGTAPGATECHFARLGADGSTITDVHSTAGSRYVETADTDSEFVTSGCQTWVRADGPDDVHHIGVVAPPPPGTPTDPNIRLVSGDGDYRVGPIAAYYTDPTSDIAWGIYSVGPNCHWQRLSNWTGENNVIASGTGPDGFSQIPGTVTVHHDDAGFRVFGCASGSGGDMFWYGLSQGA